MISYAALAIAVLAYPAAVQAQAYPAKPIRFLVPFAPGSGNDVVARLIGGKLSEVKVLRMPDILELMNKIGYTPTGTTPEQYAKIKRTESAMWAKLIKDANIRPE